MLRVGVVAQQTSGTSGGAFTFQHEIVRAIFDIPVDQEIQWIIITPAGGVMSQLGLSSEFIQHAELSLSPREHKFGITMKWFTSHLKSMLSGYRFRTTTERRSEYLEKKLSFLKLDVIWYLSPQPFTQEIPYVLTVWDIQHRLQPWFPEVSSNGIWMRREVGTTSQLQRAAILVTGNNVGATEIAAVYSIPLGRILVNPLPVPTDAVDYELNPVSSDSIRSFREGIGDFILYPARFWVHKNHKVLLEAIALLAATSGIVPKLVMTGSDAGNLDYIHGVIENLDITEHVINLGFIDRTDLLYLYSEATALVFPSMFGPDNIPPLEAMAIGCPVLVADDPGMREQLGSAALYLSSIDALEWANAITKIAQDSELREGLIALGKAKIQDCTTEKYVDNVKKRLLEFKKIRETWGSP